MSTSQKLQFGYRDVFGVQTPDRAATLVFTLFQGDPVSGAAVAERLGMSTFGTYKALRVAQDLGLVESVPSVGWSPTPKAEELVN